MGTKFLQSYRNYPDDETRQLYILVGKGGIPGLQKMEQENSVIIRRVEDDFIRRDGAQLTTLAMLDSLDPLFVYR